MKRTVTLYDFFVAKRRKGRLTTLSCLTVMHVIVGLACLLQFINLFFRLGGKGAHQWKERLKKNKNQIPYLINKYCNANFV